MKKSFQFGETALEKDWLKIKRVIQCPHIYTKIERSTIRNADAWVSAKWGRAVDYINIIRYLGVCVIED